MSVQKLPSGTRGPRKPPGLLGKLLTPLMIRAHRRKGDHFQEMDLLYLTTVGAKSGQTRTVPVSRYDDGQGGWYVVASAGGSRQHPGWYHNMVAHPDQVWAEVGGTKRRVAVEQLDGPARDAAWEQVTAASPRFTGYAQKTDRSLPILRLTPTTDA